MERLNNMSYDLKIETTILSNKLPGGEIAIDQIKDHIDVFKNLSPFYVEGIIIICDSSQKVEMNGYIGSLWQQVITALDDLSECEVTVFHCPAEVSARHMRNDNTHSVLWSVQGFGSVEYDFNEFAHALLDAAQVFFSTVTDNLSFLTLCQSDDDFASYGSYNYSYVLDYLNEVKAKYDN